MRVEQGEGARVPEGFDNSWRPMNNVWGNARIHEARGRRRDGGADLPPYIPRQPLPLPRNRNNREGIHVGGGGGG